MTVKSSIRKSKCVEAANRKRKKQNVQSLEERKRRAKLKQQEQAKKSLNAMKEKGFI